MSNTTPSPLTRREAELLPLIAQGYSNQEVAERLKVSKRTVDFHLWNIQRKLKVSNRVQVVVGALQAGWLDLATLPRVVEPCPK